MDADRCAARRVSSAPPRGRRCGPNRCLRLRCDGRAGHANDRSRKAMGLRRRGAALAVFRAVPTARDAVGSVDHLAVDRRLRDVRDRIDLGRVALLAELAVSLEARTRAFAVRGDDALASLRRTAVRPHDVQLDLQRPAVDGPVGLASGHRADAASARGGRRRPDRARRRHDSSPRSRATSRSCSSAASLISSQDLGTE